MGDEFSVGEEMPAPRGESPRGLGTDSMTVPREVMILFRWRGFDCAPGDVEVAVIGEGIGLNRPLQTNDPSVASPYSDVMVNELG